MALVCPHCQAPYTRPGQKFCSRCGKPLTPAPAPAAPTPTARMAGPQTVLVGQPGPRLIVEEGGQIRDIPLGNTPLTLGRARHHDIVLGAPFVSGNHAQIDPAGQGHRITDIGSTNGLLYHGQRLAAHTPHTLTDCDVIRIGDPTSGSFVTLTYVNPDMAAMPALPQIDLPGPGATLPIGRDAAAALPPHPQISRRHAEITGQNNRTHLLRDLGSTNGTYVNGQRIHSHTLRPDDIVQIGPFKLRYTGSALVPHVVGQAMRLEARDLVVSRVANQAGLGQRLAALRQGRFSPQKIILQQVSLCIEPGEFVALVGGSGAGKSTLMRALAGVAPASSGIVRVNGDDFYEHFDAYRAVLGYVPQDDIAHRMLPVTRALNYTARLRLPGDTAAREITDRINRVLEDVEMVEHQRKLVDHLSGGQRKRVSISLELLADPALFFLDEPTSGLDPGLEKKMMYTLRRLADSGRTVVLVTHATANIDQCDLVAFMSAGRLVYYGPPAEAKRFFGVTSNDFADIYTRIEGRYDPHDPVLAQDAGMQPIYQAWQQAYPRSKGEPMLAELWETRFQQSDTYRRFIGDRLNQAAPPGSGSAAAGPHGPSKTSNPLRQFGVLTRRYADLMLQDRRNLMILLLQAPIIAGLMALVIEADAVSGTEATFASARPVMFMLATVAVWFGIINAAREITKEAAIYRRERLANLRILPYVMSKVVVLTLLVLVQSLLLLAIVTWKVAMPEAGIMTDVRIELFVTTLLGSLAGLSLGLLISTIAATPDRAVSMVPLALIPQILLSGVIFRLEGSAEVLSWFTIGRWAMDAYGAIINLNDLPRPGLESETFDEYTHSMEHLLGRWGIMGAYTLVCLLLTTWSLRRKDKTL
ncbi:MAG: FHA domain-containing protein [Chloroflexaceae bacterium]